jgi:hypothetical protein
LFYTPSKPLVVNRETAFGFDCVGYNLESFPMKWRLVCVCLSAAVFAAGCGGGGVAPLEVPPLHPVSGTVKLDGKPEAGIAVTYYPAANNKGNGGSGTTDESGEFTLKFRDGQEGIPAGDYVVMFSKLTQKDGSPIPEGKTAADVMAIDKIPERYRLTENPRFTVKVPEGGKTDFKWEITSK